MWNKYVTNMESNMEQYDHGRSLCNKHDWWRHLEEMKNAFGRKVLVGDEKLFGGETLSSSCF